MDRFESQTSADYEVHSQAESLQIAPNGFDVQAGIEIQNFWSDCQRYASLVAALEAERRAHAETRLVLESESQRLKALEAEVYNQTNMTANWAAAYQQCYVSLQQHMNENKTLEMKVCNFSGRIQRLENRGKFYLDATAPKDRQIQVLRRKLARLREGSEGSCSDVDHGRDRSERSQSPTSEYSQSSR